MLDGEFDAPHTAVVFSPTAETDIIAEYNGRLTNIVRNCKTTTHEIKTVPGSVDSDRRVKACDPSDVSNFYCCVK